MSASLYRLSDMSVNCAFNFLLLHFVYVLINDLSVWAATVMTSPDHLLAPVVFNLAILRKNVSRQASTQLGSMVWRMENWRYGN